MADNVEERVQKLIVEQLEVSLDKVKPEATFKVEIPDEDTEKIKTVGDVINYIKSHAK